jgi:S-DNA-T family DNA segregation ATPase FtsK/SpoIIIE
MNFWKSLFGTEKKNEQVAFKLIIEPVTEKGISTAANIIADPEPVAVEAEQARAVPDTPPAKAMSEYEYPDISIFNEEQQQAIAGLGNHGGPFSLDVIWSVENGTVVYKDLAEIKNVFITGAQAMGKTNFIQHLIVSLLAKKFPWQLKFIFIDIKTVELSVCEKLDRQFLAKLAEAQTAVIKEGKLAVQSLNALCIEMDNRPDLFKDAGVRQFAEYKSKIIEGNLKGKKEHHYLPPLVLVIDDLASCLSIQGPEILTPLDRLLNSGYRTGIYMIINTNQYAGNIPASFIHQFSQKVIFKLNNKEDHLRFFDTVKVNRFRNEGEFLYNDGHPIHEGKAIMFEYDSLKKLVDLISNEPKYPQPFLLPGYIDEKTARGADLADKDSLFEDAARLIVASQVGSTSLLQRRMKVGYNRAGRLMDQLEAAGIVAPTREVRQEMF